MTIFSSRWISVSSQLTSGTTSTWAPPSQAPIQTGDPCWPPDGQTATTRPRPSPPRPSPGCPSWRACPSWPATWNSGCVPWSVWKLHHLKCVWTSEVRIIKSRLGDLYYWGNMFLLLFEPMMIVFLMSYISSTANDNKNAIRNVYVALHPQEAKTDCCSAALQHSMLEDMYGKDDGSIDWTQYGLPADKWVCHQCWILHLWEGHVCRLSLQEMEKKALHTKLRLWKL